MRPFTNIVSFFAGFNIGTAVIYIVLQMKAAEAICHFCIAGLCLLYVIDSYNDYRRQQKDPH